MNWITDRTPNNEELKMTLSSAHRAVYEGQFLVTLENKQVAVMRFYRSRNHLFEEWSKGYWATDKKVIAWRPFPEAYVS